MTGDLSLADAIEQMNTSVEVDPVEKLRVMREYSKLHTHRGQSTQGIDLMSASVVSYCRSQNDFGSGSELTARSLLSMVKWLQTDSRLMQSVWSNDYDTGHRLHMLLNAECKCRNDRMGLYQSATPSEAHELFKPDESVARFDKHEYAIGQLLHLATIHCPDLAKAWWSLAGWCYRIGRKNLEALG